MNIWERSQEDKTKNREIEGKRTLEIAYNDVASVFSYNQNDSDEICQVSNAVNYSESKGALIGKYSIF